MGVMYILTNPSFKEYVKIGTQMMLKSDCSSNVCRLLYTYMQPMKRIHNWMI